jgi:flagellar biosynthesis/type III secretory pathway chaperone
MTMHSPETLALFRRLVEQEIDCSKRLEEALATEHAALSSPTPQPLLEALTRKQELVKEMERSVAAHEGFLAARRLPPGKTGTESFLKPLPESAQERRLWQSLQEIAGHCRDRNQANGSLVALGRTRTQRALEILHGGSHSAKTYGKSGTTRGGGAQRFLGAV